MRMLKPEASEEKYLKHTMNIRDSVRFKHQRSRAGRALHQSHYKHLNLCYALKLFPTIFKARVSKEVPRMRLNLMETN